MATSGIVDEATVAEAFEKHTEYFVQNCETVTKKGVRRFLEDKLGIPEGSVDVHKKLLSQLVEELVHKQVNNKSMPTTEKLPKKQAGGDENDCSNKGADEKEQDENEEQDEDSELRTAKRKGRKPKDRKERKAAKQARPAAQQKASVASSRRVMKLKEICKAATIPVPPSIFKGQPDEDEVCERIESLLGKHGLSSSASASQIREVKQLLQKQRDLDGIDMSNIIQGRPRRGAATAAAENVNRYAAVSRRPIPGSDDDEENYDDDSRSEADGSAEMQGGGAASEDSLVSEAALDEEEEGREDAESGDGLSDGASGEEGEDSKTVASGRRRAVVFDSDEDGDSSD